MEKCDFCSNSTVDFKFITENGKLKKICSECQDKYEIEIEVDFDYDHDYSKVFDDYEVTDEERELTQKRKRPRIKRN